MRFKSFYNWPFFSFEEIQSITKILKSKKINSLVSRDGQCAKFEKEFSKYIGNKYSVAMSNGSVALELALKTVGIKKKDQVIVTSRSFVASASCVLNIGAIPVFADIIYETQNIDPNSILKLINKKTKAIVCVHLAGLPCDIFKINTIAKKNNLKLIEDCSQAHGAQIKNRHVGTFGDISTWSFCTDKIISTGGEGGIVSTNKYFYFKKLWSLKDHGKNYDKFFSKSKIDKFTYIHDFEGSNYRMTEMQASLGRIQLKKLNKNLSRRRANAKIMNDCFKKINNIKLPIYNQNIKHSFYKYYIIINKKKLVRPYSINKIIDLIRKNNIPCSAGACPEIYLEKMFENNKKVTNTPIAKLLNQSTICLEVHHKIERIELLNASKVIKAILTKCISQN